MFLFKCAENLERVEPAAISGQGEGGAEARQSVYQNGFCQLKGL